MSGQLEYVRDKNLGFHPEQIIEVPLWSLDTFDRQMGYENRVRQHSAVLSTTSLAGSFVSWPYRGDLGKMDDGSRLPGWCLYVDYRFLETLGIELIEGRNFSLDYGSDLTSGMIVTEETARRMGWEQPIGQRFPFHFRRGGSSGGKRFRVENPEVVGVEKKFFTLNHCIIH